ncbi:MAG: DUF3891 family protein [Candidatus Eremiobacteraeota bacterium]|nr:DUF3891 family protein [Candidatus Eremiobacteraeota bacterium]
MVVNPREDGWECIYQRAHAWMSYQMLLKLDPELRAPEWAAVVQATLTHDHGWMEWDEALLDSEGQPASFVVSGVDKAIKISNRGIMLAACQSLASAVFVARHVEELYGWRPEAALVEHVKGIRLQRLAWMRSLELSSAAVERSYQRVLWADSASLILCVEDEEFVKALSLTLDGVDYQLTATPDFWRMDPWPYQAEQLVVSVETLSLAQKTFSSPLELRQALKEAAPEPKKWILRPAYT